MGSPLTSLAVAMGSSTALLTDRYELTMLDAALSSGVAERRAVFEVFARSLPPGRRYGVFAGLGRVVEAVSHFCFEDEQLAFLAREKVVSHSTIEWLAGYRFSGTLDAYAEGECYFPASPVLTVEATFAEAVLLETLVLSICNFDSAVAAAASRMVAAAGERPVIEMGARRTNEEAAVAAARAAYVAGFASTSDLEAGRRYDIPTAGTAAHAFVLAHDDERQAFAAQLDVMGLGTTVLVDTYDISVAIRTAVELARERGASGPAAVRLDSGELATEAFKARRLLDELGAADTKVVITSDLDEFAIEQLASAPADSYGVGTRVVTGSGSPTAAFVYKLVAIADGRGDLRPVEKLSADKHSTGGRKRAFRLIDEGGTARLELVLPEGEQPLELPEGWSRRQLQTRVFDDGPLPMPSLAEARERHQSSLAELGAAALDLRPGRPLLLTRGTAGESSRTLRSALLVVDVQRDFCAGGTLAVNGGTAVAEGAARLMAEARGRYETVVATRDWHLEPGPHFAPLGEEPDYQTSWPRHCVAGSAGAELEPPLTPDEFDAVFDKGEQAAAYSGFEGQAPGGESLDGWLSRHRVEHIDVCGIATDYCVLETALDGRRLGYSVRVLLSLTAGVAADSTKKAVDEMRAAGVHIDESPSPEATAEGPGTAGGRGCRP